MQLLMGLFAAEAWRSLPLEFVSDGGFFYKTLPSGVHTGYSWVDRSGRNCFNYTELDIVNTAIVTRGIDGFRTSSEGALFVDTHFSCGSRSDPFQPYFVDRESPPPLLATCCWSSWLGVRMNL